MFIGHLAVGLASKRAAPRTSLGWLMAAPMFLGAAWIYARTTRARDAVGRWAFVAFVVVWVVAYLASAAPGPSPDFKTLEYGGLVTFLIPVWAWWFDAHREVTAA